MTSEINVSFSKLYDIIEKAQERQSSSRREKNEAGILSIISKFWKYEMLIFFQR